MAMVTSLSTEPMREDGLLSLQTFQDATQGSTISASGFCDCVQRTCLLGRAGGGIMPSTSSEGAY